MHYQDIIPLLRQAEETEYYGSVELKYEHGEIVIVKRSETLKPADFRRGQPEVSGERINCH